MARDQHPSHLLIIGYDHSRAAYQNYWSINGYRQTTVIMVTLFETGTQTSTSGSLSDTSS